MFSNIALLECYQEPLYSFPAVQTILQRLFALMFYSFFKLDLKITEASINLSTIQWLLLDSFLLFSLLKVLL